MGEVEGVKLKGIVEEVDTQTVRMLGASEVGRRVARSPFTVAGIVLFLYIGLTVAAFHAGAVATDFALVSWKYSHQSTVSSVITFGPDFRYAPVVGYDGQFCYFIALDPQNARFYIDNPAYRYERILYPLVARALAFGQPALIPYTLILVNCLAITGGVLLLGYWLRRRGVSPWLALVYGLFSGLLVAYERDLTEPLAFGLVILAICCFDFSRRRALWAGVCFGLAALARETTLVFAALYVLAQLFEAQTSEPERISTYVERFKEGIKRNWRPTALMLALALGPFLAYKGFLQLWLGTTGMVTSLLPNLVPFSGLISMLPPRADTMMQLLIVCAPGLISFALSLWAILRRRATVEIWALFMNALMLVVMLRPVWYVEPSPATTRDATAIVLAALLSVPAFDRLMRRDRRWLAICAPAWASYTCIYIATIAYYAVTHP